MSLSATINTNDKRRLQLLEDIKEDLQNAENIDEIFCSLSVKYSFLNFEVFDKILERYGSEEDRKKFNYSSCLKAYLECHKVKEFIKLHPLLINSKLQKLCDNTKKVVFKLDIKTSETMNTVKEITKSVARILGLQASMVQIEGVRRGCVLVTAVLPASIADALFTTDTVFSSEQKHAFRSASVLWLKCNGYTFDFREGQKKNNMLSQKQQFCNFELSVTANTVSPPTHYTAIETMDHSF